MIIKTNSKDYYYKYTDLAGIHEALEQTGYSYWQEIETDTMTNRDYIITHITDKDGKEIRKARGSEIIKSVLPNNKQNPSQEYGSSLTYARRYSLLLAFGLATTDDDAESLTGAKKIENFQKADEAITKVQIEKIKNKFVELNRVDQMIAIIQKTYNKDSLDMLTKKEGDNLLARLDKTEVKK